MAKLLWTPRFWTKDVCGKVDCDGQDRRSAALVRIPTGLDDHNHTNRAVSPSCNLRVREFRQPDHWRNGGRGRKTARDQNRRSADYAATCPSAAWAQEQIRSLILSTSEALPQLTRRRTTHPSGYQQYEEWHEHPGVPMELVHQEGPECAWRRLVPRGRRGYKSEGHQ